MVQVDYRSLVNRDLLPRERGCGSKAAYLTRGEARTAARRNRRSDGRLAPYHCRWCEHWHLGHHRRSHRWSAVSA